MYPVLDELIRCSSSRSIDQTTVTFHPGRPSPADFAFTAPGTDYDPDKDSFVLTSDDSAPNSPRGIPPPPPKKARSDSAPALLTITRSFSDPESPPGYTSDENENRSSLSKAQKKNLKKKARKKRKAMEKASSSTTQLQPSQVVNHAVKSLSHEILIVLQKSARLIHTGSFYKSKNGKKLARLTKELFDSDLAFSANQILIGSKVSLKAFNLSRKLRDEYEPSESKDEPSSSKKY